jgi:hypothetical protein
LSEKEDEKERKTTRKEIGSKMRARCECEAKEDEKLNVKNVCLHAYSVY